MAAAEQLITNNLDIWTSAIQTKSAAGRGKANKLELYGIKKLRELILELAVRGLLVPQDPSDEPASELLKKIAAEKAKLVKDGKIKKPKALPAIDEDEIPSNLPQGWEWARLGDVTTIVRGITFPASEKSKEPEAGRIACLRTANVQDQVDWGDLLYIREEFVKRDDQYVLLNDIIMSMANSRDLVGKVAIVTKSPEHKTSFGGFLGVIRPIVVNPYFVTATLRSPACREYLIGSASQTTNIANISLGKLNPMVAGVPPEAEQHRIVAKVDELMALCDQLEQQQETSITAHQTLAQTLLDTLTTASERDGFTAARARIADHFDTLFTTEWSIDQLKQTILQLAVMGKLVPQDPNDEPASELLKKIAAEKAKLVKDGKIRKQKVLSPIEEDEKSFDVPEGWEWCRLGRAGIGATGKTPSTKESKYYGGDIPFIGPGQITPDGRLHGSDKTLTEDGISESVEALPNDILMVCIGGSIGKSVVSDMRIAFNQQINAIRPVFNNPRYINIALSTEYFYELVLENATGSATPIINRSKWENLTIPIAPKNEQERIVAKVDKLMALCDVLKTRIQDAHTTQVQLADAVMDQAVV